DLDKAEALAEQTTSLSSIGNFIKAIETANRGLAFFGKSIPEDPELAEKKREQLTNEISSRDINIWDTILNMPFTTERKSKIELAFYSELIPDLYMSGLVPQLYLSAVQSTQHCLSGGMDESVIYSFSIMGLYLGDLGEFEQAFRYEDLARDLSEKYPNTFGATRGMNGVVWCNAHSRSHPEEVVKYCLKSIQCGKNCGDLYNAGLSYGPLMWNLQVQGANLLSIEEYAKECLQFSQRYHLSFSVGLAEAMQAGWIAPMKKNYAPVPMEEKIKKWEMDNHIASAGSYYVHMALTSYYFGEYEEAQRYLNEVRRYLRGLTDNVLKRQWYVFQALNALKLYERGIAYKSKEELLSFIQPIIEKIETWAKLGPLLKPYLSFIYAERERVTGEFRKARSLYFDAIAIAHEQRYTFLEGHLNECRGELLKGAGIGTDRVYLAEAVRLYKKCHAERKEIFLMERHPEYFEEEVPTYMPIEPEPVSYTLPCLDIDYLMKSSLAISAEIDPDALLNKIMNVVLEASGAQHGYLLTEEDGDMVIRAESHVAEKDVVRTAAQKLDDCKDICQPIIRYVHRTKEKFILEYGCEKCEFKGSRVDHFIEHKSILCLPVIKKAELIGILFLENRLADSVFTPEKTQMTELLTSQAAISLENARLLDEMKKAEEALMQHREHLEQMVEERTRELREAQQGLIMVEKHVGIGRLAAGVAHEIKNQLAPVLTEAQRLIWQIENGKELSPEYIMERAKTIEEATRTANKITMALLDYARESRPEFNRYNLRDSIEGVMALYQSDCKRANIQLTMEDVEVYEIFADKRQIEQVLINIINNAYEAILEKEKGGIIAISVKREESYVVISIRDTGIGIPKEDQGKIFDPFFTTKAPRGVGLGLSVSYGIVERHGGRIDFDSQIGEGTTFRIYLPIKEDIKDAVSA
ncbi:MAG: ATP-binding protein, partial [Thermodesulfovibrionales bacterium]|nr:ATP-binding protein [Thermodesulfovibrionales bacterium]